MSLPILSASRLKDARACQRLHRYRYIDGYRPAEEAGTLRFGSLVHRCLEQWWLAPAGDRLRAALAVIERATDADPFDRARAGAMLHGYDARWDDETFEVLAVEAEFRAPLVNPASGAPSRTWELGGKIDAIVRDASGGVLIVEHKTSSEDIGPGSTYWKRLRLDGQVSIYYEGARALGYDVEGCLYDVLGKPALRPYTVNTKRTVAETPAEFLARCMEAIAADPTRYFARGEVVRLELEMAEALTDVWQLGRSLHENHRAGRYPRNVDACLRYGRPCAFFGVCSGEDQLDNAALFRRSEHVHPELATVATS